MLAQEFYSAKIIFDQPPNTTGKPKPQLTQETLDFLSEFNKTKQDFDTYSTYKNVKLSSCFHENFDLLIEMMKKKGKIQECEVALKQELDRITSVLADHGFASAEYEDELEEDLGKLWEEFIEIIPMVSAVYQWGPELDYFFEVPVPEID
jgi:hypothetical protein